MAKLEILVKDGGVSETETMPVVSDTTNPAAVNQDQAKSSFLKNAVLLGAGKQVLDAGVSQIGYATGDIALERQVRGVLTGIGIAGGLAVNAPATLAALGITQASDAWVRSKTVARKQTQILQNQKLTGAIAVNNSIYGGN